MRIPPFVWLNGSLVSSERAKISLFDRGLLYGDGLFETLRAYAGRPFLLDRHLRRLIDSAEVLGIPARIDRSSFHRLLARLIAANGFADRDCAIRVLLTRGPAKPRLLPPLRCVPTLAAMVVPLEKGLARMQKDGIKAVFFDLATWPTRTLDGHKTLDYLPAIVAKAYAERRGAREAIYVQGAGEVLEGATSNVFAVLHGTLVTPPPRGILPGITRKLVLELARELKIAVRVRKLTCADLRRSREVFITASTVEILPVSDLEGRRLQAGEVTRALQAAYRQRVREELNIR